MIDDRGVKAAPFLLCSMVVSGCGSSPGTSPDGSNAGPDGSATGTPPAGLVFSAYKDTSINMNWNTNVISRTSAARRRRSRPICTAAGGKTITLAFATGECGSENWGGVQGAAMASANVPLLTQAGVKYILSTGGAAGSFTCGSDAGMATFIDRWASARASSASTSTSRPASRRA